MKRCYTETMKGLLPRPAKQCKESNPHELEFRFEDGHFVAKTQVSSTVLLGTFFDFKTHHEKYGTRLLPYKFQLLVNKALYHHNSPRAQYMLRGDFLHSFEAGDELVNFRGNTLTLIADYADIKLISATHFVGQLCGRQLSAFDMCMVERRSLVTLKPGKGKTPVALATICANIARRTNPGLPSLVVCLASNCENWVTEVYKFTTLRACWIQKTCDAVKCLQDSDTQLFITSYEMFVLIAEHALGKSWATVVCDEAHTLGNNKSARSKAIDRLTKKAGRMCYLSGTPFTCSAKAWNLCRLCDPDIFKLFFPYRNPLTKNAQPCTTEFYFAERYITPSVRQTPGGSFQWEFKISRRLEEFHALTRRFVIRDDALVDANLPGFTRSLVTIGKASDEMKQRLAETLQNAIELVRKRGANAQNALMSSQVVETARQKLPFLLKYIEEQLRPLAHHTKPEKFIVWLHSVCLFETVSAHLTKMRVQHIIVKGGISTKQREVLFDQFRDDPDCIVALLSLQACGTGINNLKHVRKSLCGELTWSYIAHTQSESRTHRMGQIHKDVEMQYLMLANSTDALIMKSMQRKTNEISRMLDNKPAKLECTSVDSTTTVTEEEMVAFLRLLQQSTEDAAQKKLEQHNAKRAPIIEIFDSISV